MNQTDLNQSFTYTLIALAESLARIAESMGYEQTAKSVRKIKEDARNAWLEWEHDEG